MKSEIRAVVTNIKRLPGCKIPFVVRRPFDMSNFTITSNLVGTVIVLDIESVMI